MKRVLLVSVGLAVLAGFSSMAAGADLYRQATPAQQPSYPLYSTYTWTGFYVGLNGGVAWGSSTWNGFPSFNTSGGLVGGTVGYNWQFAPVVVAGLEGDLDWAHIQGGGICSFGCQTTDRWLGTVRARLGYAAGPWMPYVTGGLAFGNLEGASTIGTSSATNAGWTIGAGVEYALFTPTWTVKAEYLYVNLGTFNCATCNVPGTTVSSTANIVRAGVNFRFPY